ncbi:LysR family transcriptional regulator [Streptomyces sp. CoH27]|uniref:LysR family transcriptional regulator n=1 Tax=Streptomyces sp. CoH27 TaxID=2875763 RepID=UPI001CD66BFA|nr:LysR family transcriptional regulator [Streptomyces sp. CoH27]
MDGDLDLRKIRYFLAVADEGNFTRAAASLHIAQPVLSRQIQTLERELGGPLFIRRPRSLELTPAGRELLKDGRKLLADAADLAANVRGLATGRSVFTVGHHRAISVRAAVRAFQAEHPTLTVRTVALDADTQAAALLVGDADVAVVLPPLATEGLITQILKMEPTLIRVSSEHDLAQHAEVTLTDLAPYENVRFETAGENGRPVRNVEERIELLASSTGVYMTPALCADRYRHPDVASIPVSDAPPTPILLAWASSRDSQMTRDFVAIATASTS